MIYFVWGQNESDRKDEGEPTHENRLHYAKEVNFICVYIHSICQRDRWLL